MMGEWQPIETAPKDGTKLLMSVFFPGDTICEPFTEVTIGYWDHGNALDDPESIWHREPDWDVPTIGDPTHWMPLPAPPTGDTK
jgi:hypothetical protein